MAHEPFEVSKARISHGESGWTSPGEPVTPELVQWWRRRIDERFDRLEAMLKLDRQID